MEHQEVPLASCMHATNELVSTSDHLTGSNSMQAFFIVGHGHSKVGSVQLTKELRLRVCHDVW